MTTSELFTALTSYIAGYQDVFLVLVVFLVGLACVDLIVSSVRGAWRR